MSTFHVWFYIIAAVLVALVTNIVSTIWASKESKCSLWLLLLLVLSPFVFITFGLVTSKLGLAVTSATVDSLLTVSSILLGLVLFGGWNNLTIFQCVGIVFAILGIILMHFDK